MPWASKVPITGLSQWLGSFDNEEGNLLIHRKGEASVPQQNA